MSREKISGPRPREGHEPERLYRGADPEGYGESQGLNRYKVG